MSYSVDLKERVVSYIKEGHSKVEASRVFKVGLRTIFLWFEQQIDRGTLANKVRTSRPRKIDETALREYIKKHPDHYLRKIAAVFKVTSPAIFHALKRLKITYKKKPFSTRNVTKL